MELTKEYEFLLTHPQLDEQYEGEYIAIVDDRVVAHGKDLKQVLKDARKNGKEPWIHKVHPFNKALII